MTAPTHTGQPGQPGTSKSKVYFDATGQRRHARIEVPVNDAGEIMGQPFECPRCHRDVPPIWKPLNYSKTPVCPLHPGQKMSPHRLKPPPVLPYREIWDVCEKPLRPVWALPGMAAAGLAVDAAALPTLAAVGVAVAVPAGFELTRRVRRRGLLTALARSNRVDLDDPTADRKLRAAVDAAARKTGYVAAGGAGWLAAVAALGLDPTTLTGKIAWGLLVAAWAPAAATYLHQLRTARTPDPEPADTPAAAPAQPQGDRKEQEVLHIWRTVVAVYAGDVIGTASDGTTPIKATANGKLPGASLVGWQRIRGGWKATIVGPPGVFDSDAFLAAKKKIASAFSVR